MVLLNMDKDRLKLEVGRLSDQLAGDAEDDEFDPPK